MNLDSSEGFCLWHKPGRLCDLCEGFCLEPVAGQPDAGVEMSFRIGQRVRHLDYKGERVTGVVRGLSIESEGGLVVSITLDAPIIIPASGDIPEIRIHQQHAPAHEFSPFDERDELLATLLRALTDLLREHDHDGRFFDCTACEAVRAARAAIEAAGSLT